MPKIVKAGVMCILQEEELIVEAIRVVDKDECWQGNSVGRGGGGRDDVVADDAIVVGGELMVEGVVVVGKDVV